MNKDAKEFRSKYFYTPRRTILPQRDVEMMHKKENELLGVIEKSKRMIYSDDRNSDENQK